MKRHISLLLALVMVLSLAANFAFAAEQEEIVILHTNDVHGRAVENEKAKPPVAGYAKIKAYKDSINKDGNVILLDGGDTFHGTTFATISRGESIVKLMNELGYAAQVPGNHDYNYGYDRLVELSKIAKYPILASNVVRESGKRDLQENTVVDVNGVKVGIFGLSTPETLYKSSPKNTKGVKFLDLKATAEDQVKKLKDQGATVIVAVTHLGIDESTKPEERSTYIAQNVKGIDVIVDGHSHTLLPDGKRVGDTIIVQTGGNGQGLGQLTLKLKDKKVVSASAKVLLFEDLKSVEPDKKVLEIIKEVEEKNKPYLDKVLGTTAVELNGEREANRTSETNLGNLITDAILAETKAECAITNGGGIRATIKKGEVKRQDIITSFPFTNYPVTLKVTGEEIIQALENGVKGAPEPAGCFPQVAGMTFKYDDKQPEGKRVFDLKIQGQPVDLKKEYILATNDFMAAGGDGYKVFEGKKPLKEFKLLSEVLEDYFATHKDVKAEVEKRIVREAKGEEKPGFTDVEGHWAKDYINYVVEKGYFTGLSATKFGPNADITRAMLVTVLGRYEKVDTKAYTKVSFSDSKEGAYYAPYVEWAKTEGIVKGYEDGTFKPDKEISRAEMAAIISRFLTEYKKVEVKGEVEKFTDEAMLPEWAKTDIYNVAKLGVITGFNNNGKAGKFFDPTGTSLRSQLAAIMYRMDTFVK